jgi:hypothetical protein
MTLAALQRHFAALVTGNDASAVATLLRPLNGRPARLGVYHHAYRARLIEALRNNFPVLHRVLGDDDFASLTLAYLDDEPSRRPSIRWFGHALPTWLAVNTNAVPHAALADLAAMEWAIGTSFDASDTAPLDFDALATLPTEQWPEARFAPHPSVSVLKLQWAVEPIWRALTDEEDATTNEPQALAHQMLVWRQGLETRWRSLDGDEAALLPACISGASFTALCELAASSQGDNAPAWVASALRRWVDDGLLVWA